MMTRQSEQRYDVEVWHNSDDEIEVKVWDNTHHRYIAHLVEKDVDEPQEGGIYASIRHEDRKAIRQGKVDEITLKLFEEIDREAPEHSENTLYWNLDGDSFGWARHPLWSWQSLATEGEFVGFENLYRDELLERAFDGVRQEYMDECDKEVEDL